MIAPTSFSAFGTSQASGATGPKAPAPTGLGLTQRVRSSPVETARPGAAAGAAGGVKSGPILLPAGPPPTGPAPPRGSLLDLSV